MMSSTKKKGWLNGGRGMAIAGALVLFEGLAPSQGTRFLQNAGQWPEEVAFRAERAGLRTWFTERAFVLDLGARRREDHGRGCALRFALLEADPASIRGEGRLEGLHHFLRGDDPSAWQRAVPSFEKVVYEDAWPGIDLVARDGRGAFEYDLCLEPGALLERAAFAVEGAQGLSLKDGALCVATPLGELRHTPPVAWWSDSEGARTPVECRFVLLGEDRFGFEVEGAPRGEALVVDPGVEWSSYVGAYDEDIAEDVVFALNGDVVLAGTTTSFEYPVTLGAYDVSVNGGRDAFVTRVHADGQTLVYSTLLGGAADDWGVSLGLADAGRVWVTGDTDSADFPTVAGGQDLTHNGGTDVFVAKLGPSGATLLGGTLFGGSGADHASALVLTPSFEPAVTGWTDSPSLPVSATAYDGSSNGGRDVFIASWSPDLSTLSFCSLLGGSGNDMARALARAPGGEWLVSGLTLSANFPTTSGAYDPTHNPGSSAQDGFLARLDGAATTLVHSTYFGGTSQDVVEGVALDPSGDVWIVGSSQSADLPVTSNALEATYRGMEDGFAARLSSDGSALIHGTFLAGSDRDRALDVAVDAQGYVAIIGDTRSTDFPDTVWSFDSTFNSPAGAWLSDAFVLRLEPQGGLDYGGYLGGLDDDLGLAIALDSVGGAVMVGATNSYNFPTTYGSYDSDYDLSYIYDGFVTRFDFAHFPHNFGTAKINSQNSWAVLGYSGFPSLANGSMTVYLDGGIPFSYGFLFWSTQPGGGPFMGGELLMGPPYTRTGQLALDWFGSAGVSVPIDGSMVGSTLLFQAWYADPTDPFGVGLSDGLSVTFYP